MSINRLLQKAKRLRHPITALESFLYRNPSLCNDKMWVKLVWKRKFGYPLNLNNPKLFNEKLQWLKLYDHNPLYTTLVDKYAVKEYVANIIGMEYIIPTLGVWEKGEDIEWDKLPDQFVLKCTHDSGGLVICRDKSTLNKDAAIGKWLRCV